MASKPAIARALAVLQAVFPRDITTEMAEGYRVALLDIDDTELIDAVAVCLATCRFFPVPAELRAVVPPSELLPPIHATEMISRIQGLGHYDPHGWRYPSVSRVRAELGMAAAEAYGHVGSHRLYSENERTRDIAERDFSEVLRAAVKDNPRAALPQPSDKLLDGPMHPDVMRRLKAEFKT